MKNPRFDQELWTQGYPDTWEEALDRELLNRDESWEEIVKMTCSEGFLKKPWPNFNSKPAPSNKDYEDRIAPFTVWTAHRVYFPAGYDSSYWVESVPRNPCDEAKEIVGGGV